MKIGIICYNHFDATIPLGKYLLQLSPHITVEYIFILSRSNLAVEILNFQNCDLKNGFIDKQVASAMIDKEIFNYIPSIELKVFLFNSIKLSDYKNFKLLSDLKKNIVSNNYDILHFIGNNPWIVLLNYLIKNKPKIHTLHEPYPFIQMNKYRLLRFKLNVKLMVYSSTHIIVPSKTSFGRLHKYYAIPANKVTIIPFGPFEIYKEYCEKEISKETNIILYYGHISKYKGIHLLVKAMSQIYEFNKNLKLIIAGSGAIDSHWTLSNTNIEFINRYLTNKEIAELNQIATLVVCPYIGASQSGVVMTSFAFGNPIIATNVGALPEMIEHNLTGVIIEPGNSDILCKTIMSLFEDQRTIQKLSCNARKKFLNSNASWKYIAMQTYKLYENLQSLKSTTIEE